MGLFIFENNEAMTNNNFFQTLKHDLYEELFPGKDNAVNRAYNIGMLLLISFNVIAVIIETEKEVYETYKSFFDGFEIISVLLFSIEYLVRLWVCTGEDKYRAPRWGRLRYVLEPMTIIDLISFLPFYLPFTSLDLRFLRALRLFRLFRLFKLGRYSASMATLVKVVRVKKEELFITLFSGVIILVISSSIMYLVENHAQPDSFSSIPSAMWWGVATLTTVGYGDIYPKTLLGKFLGSLIAVLGIGLFALPAGIIASGFASELQTKKNEKRICPHCGKDIE